MNESTLIENAELRDQMMERIDVLDKVKKLFLVPSVDVMPLPLVAEWFDVDADTIKKVYVRNKDEIDADGVVVLTKNELKGQAVPLVQTQTGSTFSFDNGMVFKLPNRGVRAFSKRAILRIAMLLRDSEIAKEVRTQLLNTFEQTTDEQRTYSVDEEMKLAGNVTQALFSGDLQQIGVSMAAWIGYKNRYIDELKSSNQMLAGQILEWDERAKANKVVRVMAWRLGMPYSTMWNKLYNELLYKWHINLKSRGDTPYIQYVKEDEWKFVQQSLAALCECNGLSVAKVMDKARMIP